MHWSIWNNVTQRSPVQSPPPYTATSKSINIGSCGAVWKLHCHIFRILGWHQRNNMEPPELEFTGWWVVNGSNINFGWIIVLSTLYFWRWMWHSHDFPAWLVQSFNSRTAFLIVYYDCIYNYFFKLDHLLLQIINPPEGSINTAHIIKLPVNICSSLFQCIVPGDMRKVPRELQRQLWVFVVDVRSWIGAMCRVLRGEWRGGSPMTNLWGW